MLKAIKRMLGKIKAPEQTPGVYWLLDTPYANY